MTWISQKSDTYWSCLECARDAQVIVNERVMMTCDKGVFGVVVISILSFRFIV